MEPFKTFFEQFLLEQERKKDNRGGHNKASPDSSLPSYKNYEFKYYSIDGEMSYLIGSIVGRESFFKKHGYEAKTPKRCIQVKNTETDETGFISYNAMSQLKSGKNVKIFKPDEITIEPDEIDIEKTKKKIERDMSPTIEYVDKNGDNVILRYVEGSGGNKEGLYTLDGHDGTVSAKYAQEAKRKLKPLTTIIANLFGGIKNYNLINSWKESGFDNVKEIKINGKRFVFINVPGSETIYVLNRETKLCEPLNLSGLKTVLNYSNDKDEYEVEPDFESKILFKKSKRLLSLQNIDKKLKNSNARIRRWEQKEKQISSHLNDVLQSKNDKYSFTVKGNPPTGSYGAKQVGGKNNSDINVFNLKSKNDFSIECKLNYTSGEYFKYYLGLKNGNLFYKPDSGYTDEQKASLSEVFGINGENDRGMLGKIQQNETIRQQIKGFYDNNMLFLRKVSQFMETRQNDAVLNWFFKDNEIVADEKEVRKMEFPQDLIPLLQSFDQYLNFICEIKKNEPPDVYKENIPLVGLYNQIKDNLSELFNKKGDEEIDSFLEEYEQLKDSSELFRFLYTNICSEVVGKTKRNVLELFSIRLKSGDEFIQKINDYYTQVHNCRYLEIGTYPFGEKSEYNDATWQSNVYILDVNNESKIPRDPLNLGNTYKNKVFDIEKLKQLPVSISARVAENCSKFKFQMFIGNTDNEHVYSNGENSPTISFEDIKMINMEQEF